MTGRGLGEDVECWRRGRGVEAVSLTGRPQLVLAGDQADPLAPPARADGVAVSGLQVRVDPVETLPSHQSQSSSSSSFYRSSVQTRDH